jgi:hypothetical protein
MEFKYNDGGRAASGYKGHTSDCVCRSIAIILEKPYQEVYDDLNNLSKNSKKKKVKNSNSRTGVHREIYKKYLISQGMKWTPTMLIGKGCKVHLRANELPSGRLVVRVSKHLTAVIDGVINDTFNPSREVHVTGMENGIPFARIEGRCVYGYFSF